MGFDVKQFKTDFATLMAVLEEASAKTEEEPVIEEVVTEETKTVSFKDVLKGIFESRFVKYAGSAAAGFAVSLVTTAVISSIRK